MNAPANAGDMGSVPGLGRSPGGGNGNSLQYSCLKNPTDRGTWRTTVHGVTKSLTWLWDSTHAQGHCALSCSISQAHILEDLQIASIILSILSVGTLTVGFRIQHTECSWHLHLLNRWMELPGSHPLFQKDHFQVVSVPEAGGSRKHGLD